jgi:DNA-binding NarL/FixJ family response regulator
MGLTLQNSRSLPFARASHNPSYEAAVRDDNVSLAPLKLSGPARSHRVPIGRVSLRSGPSVNSRVGPATGNVPAVRPSSGTVVVVDDDPDSVQIYCRALTGAGFVVKFFEANDSKVIDQALTYVHLNRVDLIISDLCMPFPSGYKAEAHIRIDKDEALMAGEVFAQRVWEEKPATKIVFFSQERRDCSAAKRLQKRKNATFWHKDKEILSPMQLANNVQGIIGSRASSISADVHAMTDRLSEVLYYICQGLQNKDIARRLGISEGVVRKHHVSRLLREYRVRNRTELVVEITRRGISVPLPSVGAKFSPPE